MRVAVIIPFRPRGDGALLHWALEGYAQQRFSAEHQVEVLVGFDGPEAVTEVLTAGQESIKFTTHRFPQIGAAAVRNRLAREAQADLLVFVNADARPEPKMVQQHIEALASVPFRALVLGSAPWDRSPEPTAFEAFVQESPCIFSYSEMKPQTWYDFRHAWTVNLAVRKETFSAAGGFHDELRPVFYEDLAFAFRLMQGRREVWFEPAAQVIHHHPMTLDQYLDREEMLGLMAPVLARVSPGCYATLFGAQSPVVAAERLKASLGLDRGLHHHIYKDLQELERMPEAVLGSGETRQRQVRLLHHLHIPLKRLAFRLGFLKGLALAEDSRWEQRKASSLWRKVVA